MRPANPCCTSQALFEARRVWNFLEYSCLHTQYALDTLSLYVYALLWSDEKKGGAGMGDEQVSNQRERLPPPSDKLGPP